MMQHNSDKILKSKQEFLTEYQMLYHSLVGTVDDPLDIQVDNNVVPPVLSARMIPVALMQSCTGYRS